MKLGGEGMEGNGGWAQPQKKKQNRPVTHACAVLQILPVQASSSVTNPFTVLAQLYRGAALSELIVNYFELSTFIVNVPHECI